jgi:hypothetical protein
MICRLPSSVRTHCGRCWSTAAPTPAPAAAALKDLKEVLSRLKSTWLPSFCVENAPVKILPTRKDKNKIIIKIFKISQCENVTKEDQKIFYLPRCNFMIFKSTIAIN